MHRRALLAGSGLALSASLVGCLGEFVDSPPDTHHCPEPDDNAEAMEYDELLITNNRDWLATEFPDLEPHLVLLRSEEDAAEMIDLDHVDDEDKHAFLEEADYDTSSLLVAEHSIAAGYKLMVHGVEWRDTKSVHVYLCEEDHREEDTLYPGPYLRSRVLRVHHDERPAPERATGFYVTNPADGREMEVSEYEANENDENED